MSGVLCFREGASFREEYMGGQMAGSINLLAPELFF